MTNEEREKLAVAWINFQHEKGDKENEEHPDWWAVSKMFDLIYDKQPEELWLVIILILEKDQSDIVLGNLSAGALEDLLANYGQNFIVRIEEQARKDPAFRNLLGGVWKNSMTDEIWERVEKARLYKNMVGE